MPCPVTVESRLTSSGRGFGDGDFFSGRETVLKAARGSICQHSGDIHCHS